MIPVAKKKRVENDITAEYTCIFSLAKRNLHLDTHTYAQTHNDVSNLKIHIILEIFPKGKQLDK